MQPFFLLALAFAVQGSDVLSGHTRDVDSLAISPDGAILASGSTDRTIRLWDTKTRTEIGRLEGHDGQVRCLVFSSDGKVLVSGESYSKVIVWDVPGKKELRRLEGAEASVGGVAISPDGNRVFAATRGNAVLMWDLDKGGAPVKLPHGYQVHTAVLSRDGRVLATSDDGGTIKLWDGTTGEAIRSFRQDGKAKALAISQDGTRVASGGGEAIFLWDVASGDPVGGFRAERCEANALAFTPDGKMLVVGTQESLVLFLNAEMGATKLKAEKHDRPVTCVAVSPDGKTAYTGSMDMKIRVWAVPN